MKQIPEDLREDFGFLANEIVDEIVRDSVLPAKDVIALVAGHYDVCPAELIKCLKLVNSPFTANNNVVFYDGEKFVKRTTHLAQVHRIFDRLKVELHDLIDDDTVGDFAAHVYDRYSIG
jgi:hypothetical protein